MAEDEIDLGNGLVVSDRSRIISEYVYGPILKSRPLAYDYADWQSLLIALTVTPTLVVWCTRPYDSIKSTFTERDQLGGVYDNLFDLYQAYDQLMNYLRFLSTLEGTRVKVVKQYFGDEGGRVTHLYQKIAQYIEEVS
jgi:hypothetical protein